MTMIANPAVPPTRQAAGAANSAGETAVFGEDGLSFKDIIDAVNPLQQLPGLGTIYRAASGDTLSMASRVAGGALLGGPIGAGIALVSGLFEAVTGKDPAEAALAMITGEEGTDSGVKMQAKGDSGMAVANEPVLRKAFATASVKAPATSIADVVAQNSSAINDQVTQRGVKGIVMDSKLRTNVYRG